MRPRALALTGPTTSGKTSLGLELARRLDAEIVSMDSRQVYRGMDIGTDKVTRTEREGIPHFGLDLVDPSESYSAGQYARDVRRWVDEIGLVEADHRSDASSFGSNDQPVDQSGLEVRFRGTPNNENLVDVGDDRMPTSPAQSAQCVSAGLDELNGRLFPAALRRFDEREGL